MRKARRCNPKSKRDFQDRANSLPRLLQSSNQVRQAFGPLEAKAPAGRMLGRDNNEQQSRFDRLEVPRPRYLYPLPSRSRAGPYGPTDRSSRLARSAEPADGRTERGLENFQFPLAARVPAASAQHRTRSRLAPGISTVV